MMKEITIRLLFDKRHADRLISEIKMRMEKLDKVPMRIRKKLAKAIDCGVEFTTEQTGKTIRVRVGEPLTSVLSDLRKLQGE